MGLISKDDLKIETIYSISSVGFEPIDEYQLPNLGKERKVWLGRINDRDFTTTEEVSSETYDNVFFEKIYFCNPIYKVKDLLKYHFDFYGTSPERRDIFFDHIEYVILPLFKKDKNPGYSDLISKWLKENKMNKENNQSSAISLNNVSGNIQIQNNTTASHQTQSISYSNNDINSLFEVLKKDIALLVDDEIKQELSQEVENAEKHHNKGKDISSRLQTIGSLINDVGINVFANLIASPIFEIMKPYLGM